MPAPTTEIRKPSAESLRLYEVTRDRVPPWRKWGPFVCERSWGSVREDYSPDGTAWDYLPHDLARSKAYRWGEDGIAGICDRYQVMVFALALWNGRDPILKERMYGMNSNEGNHGEDCKEYWFYLDNTPTHSYMKMLYKYPQREFPYGQLIEENRRRAAGGNFYSPEYELLDTGIFDDDRYFDVFIEYAKAGPEDICVRIQAFNRGPDAATLHLLPHLWFRNTWSWSDPPQPEPVIKVGPAGKNAISLHADDSVGGGVERLKFSYRLGQRYLYADASGRPLFTDNETNAPRVFGPWAQSRTHYVKDAFHRHIIHGEDCVNPDEEGTKACIHYRMEVPAQGVMEVRLRLTTEAMPDPLAEVDSVIKKRKAEADEFYATVHPATATADEKLVQRQALAGMLWSKMIYLFDVGIWLNGDNPKWPPPASRKRIRNIHWQHLNSMRVLSMPDKWEFPWIASWDMAFQSLTLALVDLEFAKDNLWVLLFEQFQHPNGQIPGCEWEYSDINPPVQAWACWKLYQFEKRKTGTGDKQFLEKCFHKMIMNFAWWVNQVDRAGNNVFEGGFLGLDNITVVDRSEKIPGATLEQSDATGWMGFYCLYLMRIALELSLTNKSYEVMATKFFEHFIYIGAAMKRMGGRDYQLWDERDGFFYDVMRYEDGTFHKFRVRSLVGLIPMYAVEVLHSEELAGHPSFQDNVEWFIRNHPDLVGATCTTVSDDEGTRYVLSIVDSNQLTRLLQRMWDGDEFLSDYGIRSLSRYHREHPFHFGNTVVHYAPAEENVKIKGGNSNWRGPLWFPTTYLLIESLLKFSDAFGSAFRVDTPAGGARPVAPSEMAHEIAERMINIFKRGKDGRRPVFGDYRKFQEDPLWRDCLLIHEYYHGDTGAGIGASHQTGWSGLVANFLDEWRS